MSALFNRLFRPTRARLIGLTGISAAAAATTAIYNRTKSPEIEISKEERQAAIEWVPPSRQHLIDALKGSAAQQGSHADGTVASPSQDSAAEFDLLIIGGGATGAGCALDAAARGLRVACVEREDFSSGTSSKSTKLVHGGVRYLEKAIRDLDIEQYKLVREALAERATFLKIAPHLTSQIPLMLPIYKWWLVPYYWAGSKMYDLLSGGAGLTESYYMTKASAMEAFPMLKANNLVGAVVYYDGQQDDSRMNLALALTAIQRGAIVTNYMQVVDLIKVPVENGQQIRGAMIKDTITGEVFPVRAKGVINATGPFCDAIRKMDDPSAEAIVCPSSGTHIVLPSYYSPNNIGLLDPATSDGRVIFFLPWQDRTIVGTTDEPSDITFEPKATDREIDFIIGEVANYLDPTVKVRRNDILAAWSGIRPLVKDPDAKNTSALVRNHLINISKSGLLTIVGGKWTTYRSMACETIDEAIKAFNLKPKTPNVSTNNIPVIGAHGYTPLTFVKLIRQFGFDTKVAQHLATSYGDRAFAVAAISESTRRRWPVRGRRLARWYPYIDSEVRYAVRYEYACTAIDILARRTRLAFLNCLAAHDALPTVLEIMAEELAWSPDEVERQRLMTENFLKTVGIDQMCPTRTEFSREDFQNYRKAFNALDTSQRGRLPIRQLLPVLKQIAHDEHYAESQTLNWKSVIEQVETDKTGTFDFSEFLEIITILRDLSSGSTAAVSRNIPIRVIPPERSGGGL